MRIACPLKNRNTRGICDCFRFAVPFDIIGKLIFCSTNRELANSAFTPVKAEYGAQCAAFVPPPGGISCAAAAALSYALRADFITGLPVYSLSVATGFRCISSGTSLSARIDILPFIGICKALKLHFYFPKERNEISKLHIGSTAADATVTSRRVRGSMKSTLRVDEIPACAGMKCSRVAPARNTRARLGCVAGLCEPLKLGFIATA